MKRYLYALMGLAMLGTATIGYSAVQQEAAETAAKAVQIGWQTNYEAALKTAKENSIPLVILFTGSDWCTWCKKLEQEVFESPDFIKATSGKFQFLKVDFPLYSKLDPKQTQQNNELKSKYEIRGFPTLIVLESNKMKPIATLGYKPGGGQVYAEYLISTIKDYTKYEKAVQKVVQQTPDKEMNPQELEHLYNKAVELGLPEDAKVVMEAGIASPENAFFLKEKYRALVEEGMGDTSDAHQARQKAIAADPVNKHKIHYDVAVIDFQHLADKFENGEITPEQTVAPLLAYIKKFGDQDPDITWRLQMTISQIYSSKELPSEALRYAEASYTAAPDAIKPEIAKEIQEIHQLIDQPVMSKTDTSAID